VSFVAAPSAGCVRRPSAARLLSMSHNVRRSSTTFSPAGELMPVRVSVKPKPTVSGSANSFGLKQSQVLPPMSSPRQRLRSGSVSPCRLSGSGGDSCRWPHEHWGRRGHFGDFGKDGGYRRRHDVYVLRRRGLVPYQISDALSLSDETVSRYLRELEDAGAIERVPSYVSR
jgi:DNA-binding transcriptional ArsR family regulator